MNFDPIVYYYSLDEETFGRRYTYGVPHGFSDSMLVREHEKFRFARDNYCTTPTITRVGRRVYYDQGIFTRGVESEAYEKHTLSGMLVLLLRGYTSWEIPQLVCFFAAAGA